MTPHARRAMTLMEVVVALLIVSLLMAALYGAFRTAWVAERSGTEAIQRTQAAAEAVRLFRMDLLGATRPETTLGGEWTAELSGETGTRSFSFNTNSAIREIDYAGLTQSDMRGSIASRWPRQTIGGDVQQVTWSLEPSTTRSDAYTLVRGTTRNVLATREVELGQRVILRNVRAMWLRYFDGTEWLDEWETASEGDQLPIAVEVIIELAPREDARPAARGTRNVSRNDAGRRLTTIVYLPMTTMDEETEALR